MQHLLVFLFSLLLASTTLAAIQSEAVPYTDGDLELEGYLAYDDGADGPRPAVLVVHEWWGLGKHARDSARDLAEMGYVGFAVDMYGAGKLTEDPGQAAEWSGALKNDPDAAVQRFRAALDLVRAHPRVDSSRVAALGYCFGGTMVLEMARSGVDLDGVVSFHGGLGSEVPEAARSYAPRFLVLHGADDPFVPEAELDAFRAEMQAGGADWQLVMYGNAVHSFTNPEADGSLEGAQYDATAAARSWRALGVFLRELYGD